MQRGVQTRTISTPASFAARQLRGRTGDALFAVLRGRASCAPSAGSTAPIPASYRETLDNPALNLDIAQTRTGRIKYGYVVNVEQALTDDDRCVRPLELERRQDRDHGVHRHRCLALARRLDQGHQRWGRPDDVIGIGGAINALSRDHRDFIAAGGLGVLIGDGQLNYRERTDPRDLLRLRAHQAAHADRRLPVHCHQPRLTTPTAASVPHVFSGRFERGVLGLPSSLPSADT